MNQNDMMMSIGRAKTLTSSMEEANVKLSFYHSSPLNAATQLFITFVVNFFWVGLFVGLTYASYWTLLAAPVMIYFFRGTKVSQKVESVLMRQKLAKYEDAISSMLRARNECVSELRAVTGLHERFFTRANMDLFEGFIHEGKATNFEECAALIA